MRLGDRTGDVLSLTVWTTNKRQMLPFQKLGITLTFWNLGTTLGQGPKCPV